MITKVVIIGGKGTAVNVAENIYDAQLKGQKIEMLGFAFDDESFGKEINGFPILCKTFNAYEKYKNFNDIKFIFQLYRADLMRERSKLLNSYGIPIDKYCSFVHPSSMVAKSVEVGAGCAVLANSVINSNAVIGNHCTILSNSTIGHDTKMGENNFIATNVGIGSSINIGCANFFGINSAYRESITIGDHCVFGMGSVVVKSIPSGVKVVGNPAKIIN